MTLTLAIPSKGRLKDKAVAALAGAGIHVASAEDSRSYRTSVTGAPGLEVLLLSASEIARELRDGAIDFGITGEDLIRETIAEPDQMVETVARLGFGHADVVVAVPDAWVDVETMEDLNDVAGGYRARHGRRLRVATKYWRLTQSFFTRRNGIQSYRIVESLGATEGTPAAGSADVIVDITSTGSTLTANHLKILSDGVILRSQACLIRSLVARDRQDVAEADALAARFGSAPD
ncbi:MULTISPECIES: ATP phosphoribosyltransferase [Aurantimonas]|jgi:ATP phosphoribosyltransferase|uniref:ATP phosphoribosyltransferase n=1 Tax=Aurantimonas TaxID=182269 RepID=UPI0004221F8C|nr:MULTISPECIES: ATP phosphoribosyltransferase [Aurantimonas]MBC6718886.1 ATP phosphoribosyltransferase [Aurantimonas sp. DM33-3]MCD1643859.1 ATP phosphoribosyltransferase [Aurantimonas coralicida]MCW7543514.1 ATP phosphoribosyltransferase [Aurantimonas litoralis]